MLSGWVPPSYLAPYPPIGAHATVLASVGNAPSGYLNVAAGDVVIVEPPIGPAGGWVMVRFTSKSWQSKRDPAHPVSGWVLPLYLHTDVEKF